MPLSPRDPDDLAARREETIPTAEIPPPAGARPAPVGLPPARLAPPPPSIPLSSSRNAPALPTGADAMQTFAAPISPTEDALPPGLAVTTSERATIESPTVSIAAAAKPLDVSIVAGRYEVEKTLGEGGMGAVYRVFDRELKRRCALKMIHEKKRDEKREKRFLMEARAMAKLSHPACVQVYDIGTTRDGAPYLTMELVQGEPLVDVIARGDLSPRRAALWIHGIAGALQCVHEAGLIHRDVKPHNILVGPGGAKLADFGIVKDEEALTRLTAEGAMIGTLAYMPPEQTARTKEGVDSRADVYALGATLYHCLVGAPPFMGPQAVLVELVLGAEPVPPRRQKPDVPPDLEAICLRCLAKSRDDRYATARELQEDLARFLADEPVTARRPGLVERTVKAVRRHRGLIAVALTGSVAAAAVLGAVALGRRASTRGEARRELERGESELEKGAFDRAEEAFLNAARLDDGLAEGARERVRRAQAWKLASLGEEALARCTKAAERLRDDEAALAPLESHLANGQTWASDAEKRHAATLAAGIAASRAELARLEGEAEVAMRDALALVRDPVLVERQVALLGKVADLVADEDPARAERIASEIDKTAGPGGGPKRGTVVVASQPRADHVRLFRYALDPAAGVERPRPVSRAGADVGAAASKLFELVPGGDDLGPTPTTAVSLPSGDYVALIEADGRFAARVPFEVARKKTVDLRVSLYPRELLGDRADDFVFVAGGEARTGRRVERCGDFFLMKGEVSRRDWAQFLRDTGEAPAEPRDATAPASGVTEEQALSFASWYASRIAKGLEGKWDVRLPTRVELARALRGPLRRTFSWGDLFDASFLAAGAVEDESPLGALGLSGGVAELTSDPDAGGAQVVFGGAAKDPEALARAAVTSGRGVLAPNASDPATGLRLAVVKR